MPGVDVALIVILGILAVSVASIVACCIKAACLVVQDQVQKNRNSQGTKQYKPRYSPAGTKYIPDYIPDPRASDGVIPKGEPLTPGEIAVVKSRLGEQVDAARIKKYHYYLDKDIQSWVREPISVAGPEIIQINGAKYYERDYSSARSSDNHALFVQAIESIPQYQPSEKISPRARKARHVLSR